MSHIKILISNMLSLEFLYSLNTNLSAHLIREEASNSTLNYSQF